jgi:hypothetical protein
MWSRRWRARIPRLVMERRRPGSGQETQPKSKVIPFLGSSRTQFKILFLGLDWRGHRYQRGVQRVGINSLLLRDRVASKQQSNRGFHRQIVPPTTIFADPDHGGRRSRHPFPFVITKSARGVGRKLTWLASLFCYIPHCLLAFY